MKKHKWFRKVVNYLSGAAQCIAGGLLIVKGIPEAGVAQIIAGVAKITAQEVQQKEVNKMQLRLNESSL